MPATPASTQPHSSARESSESTSASPASTSRGKSRRKASSAAIPQFAWTTKAAETLLRLCYGPMKRRFQDSKSSKQLAAAWDLMAAETFRLGGLKVDAGQCKSKLKHMHKQYTAYRVAQAATGNTTERPLNEPPCFATICDVWRDLEGMVSEAFFSSDTSSTEMLNDLSVQGVDQSPSEETSQVGLESDADHDGNEGGGGWRRCTGKRAREKADAAEGML